MREPKSTVSQPHAALKDLLLIRGSDRLVSFQCSNGCVDNWNLTKFYFRIILVVRFLNFL